MSARFTLHGSPHSLPTYRVAEALPGFADPFDLLPMQDAKIAP